MISSERFVGESGTEGATLLEVMMALILLALLLVPFARGVDSAVGGAASVRARAEKVAEGFGSSAAGQAWEWGPVLATAVWRPGPNLELNITARQDTACAAGLWCDGWYLGERTVDPEGKVHVEASDLRDLSGGELLVRVRDVEGVWGPPWRSTVPDTTGVLSVAEEARDGVDVVCAPELLPRAVVHAPALANPGIEVSSGCGVVEVGHSGLTFCIPESSEGWLRADIEGCAQYWWMAEGRSLDLYF